MRHVQVGLAQLCTQYFVFEVQHLNLVCDYLSVEGVTSCDLPIFAVAEPDKHKCCDVCSLPVVFYTRIQHPGICANGSGTLIELCTGATAFKCVDGICTYL